MKKNKIILAVLSLHFQPARLLILILLTASGFATFNTYAQPGEIDLTFNPTDVGFGNGDGTNNYELNAIAIQNDGKIIIGGDFTLYNGISRNRLARINVDGTLDSSFIPGLGIGTNFIHSIAIQNDGKIIIGGDFNNYNGITTNNIARLNIDGTLDASFISGVGANEEVRSISIQNDGKILIGGDFTTYSGLTRNYIARINSDGTLDASFNPGTGANNNIFATVIQTDGKILIGGAFTSYNGSSRNYIARLNPDGSIDASYNQGTGFNSFVGKISLQIDGKIIVGGDFTTYNGSISTRIARINIDGSIDSGFDPGTGANWFVECNILQNDGKIIIGGNFTTYNGTTRKHLARLNTDGTHDITFNEGSGSNSQIWTTSIQNDGKIIIGGDFTIVNGTPINKLARLNIDGSLDFSFNIGSGFNSLPTYNCWVTASCLQTDGKIIIGGYFSSYNGTTRNNIVRLNSDGTLDLTFNPGTGTNNTIRTISIQSDGKIILGGDFTSYNGTTRNYLARINSDGAIDNSFNPGTGPNNTVWASVVQNDGKIVISGDFITYGGSSRSRITRINSNGTLDASFNPGTGLNFSVRTLSIQSDGKIILGGNFTLFNGNLVNRICRVQTNGGLDNTFILGSGADNWVYNTSIQNDGKILMCGDFISYNGSNSNRIVRLNLDGSIDINFNSGSGSNNTVYTSSIQSDGKIIIGGAFDSYHGTGRNRVARIDNNNIITSLFGPSVYCAGDNLSVSYTVTGIYNAGNVFTAELSDASGSFVTPTAIGSLSSTTNGTIVSTIPISQSSGAGYRIRVVSSDFVSTSPDNGTNINIYSIASSTPVVACYSYTWTDGNTYTTSGQYTQTLINAIGCDSIATLDLTINQSTSSTVSSTACNSYMLNSQTFTTSGSYTQNLTNASGCDSTLTLNLTINSSTTSFLTITECDSFNLNGTTYTVTGIYTQVLTNSVGCDSTISLDLTIIPSIPMSTNTFSIPSDANSCNGALTVSINGNSDFNLDLDAGAISQNSTGYSLLSNICPGVHSLFITDNCGDTLDLPIIIPVDSNYVYNNAYIDSLALDSLGVTIINCDIYYNSIDTAYIDSVFATGNTVTVIWNIIDSNGSNYDTTYYVLNNGNGVYFLQLSIYCPTKAIGEYFTVTEAYYFEIGFASITDNLINDHIYFNIYPNPTGDNVTIKMSAATANIEIIDAHGKLLRSFSILNGGTISLSSFEPGVYFLRISADEYTSLHSIVKN